MWDAVDRGHGNGAGQEPRITASTRRLAWGGAAFGVAGAVEGWAILPVLVLPGLRWDADAGGGRGVRGRDGGRVPAVAAVWWQAFRHARFAWLSRLNHRRIAWIPALRGYFRSHFTRVLIDRRGDALYRRLPRAAAVRGGTGHGERNAGNQRSGG